MVPGDWQEWSRSGYLRVTVSPVPLCERGRVVTALNSATLTQFDISHPTYDRSAVNVGIVHFGVGNFHRAQQAMYVDRLLEQGLASDWGICGVGVLPSDATMRDVMREQDCLYTLVLRHADGTLEPRIVGSIVEFLFGPEQPEAVYARLMEPGVRIVTLTVTEGGYLKNPVTGEFDATHSTVVHDVKDLAHPQTSFAYIIEALRRRRDAGMVPFTVLSCDNLQGNGDVTRNTVVEFARLIDADLAEWIAQNVSFPNCMVDRITPATTDGDREAVSEHFGIEDRWPVPGEEWVQWIIEDHFTAGRPNLEEVGVQFVEDVVPYELMKLRLLNASHQAIAYLGAPLGHVLVHDAMADDRIRVFLERYMADEARLTLGDLPGIDVDAYMAKLIERFSNPKVCDTLVRLSTDGSNRMPTFAVPSIRENVGAGRDVPLGALLIASWAEFWAMVARGEIAASEVPVDVKADEMARAASNADPLAFLELRDLLGDLADHPEFVARYVAARAVIAERGIHAAIDAAL